MFAQLLAGSQFVNMDLAVDLLSNILVQARHIDVRVATIGSLVDLLVVTDDEKTTHAILSALENMVAVAADVNERYPMTEERWMQCEAKSSPPEMYELSTLPPILDALMIAAMRCSAISHATKRRAVFNRLLLPIFDLSTENHHRWLRVFLQQEGFDATVVTSLPPIPCNPGLLVRLLNHFYDDIPRRILDLWSAYNLARFQPSAWITSLVEHVLDDVDLRLSNAGKHWLSLWSDDDKLSLFYDRLNVSDLLMREMDTKAPDGITLQHVQELWWTHTKFFIDGGTRFERERKKQLDNLLTYPDRQTEEHRIFYEQSRPLIVTAIDYITQLRTSKWQHDHERKPDTLPDTTDFRMFLLAENLATNGDPAPTAEMRTGAIEVFLREWTTGNRPYHQKFARLKRCLQTLDEGDRLSLALDLGSLKPTEPSLTDSLLVELADDLVAKWHQGKYVLLRRKLPSIHSMLEKWTASPVEEFRVMGKERLEMIQRMESH